MIVPMKRVTVLCLAHDRDETLDALASLGLVHVEETVTDTPSIAAAVSVVEASECVRDALAVASAAKDPLDLALRLPPAGAELSGPVAEAAESVRRYAAARTTRSELRETVARFAPWGDFDPAAARRLAEAGVPVSLFRLSREEADALAADLPAGAALRRLSETKDDVFGALIGAPLPEGVAAAPLPPESLSALRARIDEAEETMRAEAAALARLAARRDEFAAALRAAEDAKRFAVVAENLREAGPVRHVQGWIPADGADALIAAARNAGWGVAIRDPEPGETPPVQLRPPRFFRPIVTVFKALGILPGYEETDVSVPFYVFFTVFFAMLIGDAGYGALMLLAWFWLRRRARRAGGPSPALRPILTLMLVFSAATIVWGVLNATWFGIPHDAAHPWLPQWMIPPTAAWLGDQTVIMHVCFSIGLAHLLLARFWNVAQLWPDSRALAQIGWAGVLVAMYCIVCSIAISYFVYPAWATWLLAASVVLILLFTYKRSELKENAVSLAMTPLNVVSSMGDVISYVRLFAVSLAAVKIAETFNTMAGDMGLPLWAKIPVMVVILLLGHALNLAMSALSILVHAVRLNTLEFSSAKGISWSGAEYDPFQSPRT